MSENSLLCTIQIHGDGVQFFSPVLVKLGKIVKKPMIFQVFPVGPLELFRGEYAVGQIMPGPGGVLGIGVAVLEAIGEEIPDVFVSGFKDGLYQPVSKVLPEDVLILQNVMEPFRNNRHHVAHKMGVYRSHALMGLSFPGAPSRLAAMSLEDAPFARYVARTAPALTPTNMSKSLSRRLAMKLLSAFNPPILKAPPEMPPPDMTSATLDSGLGCFKSLFCTMVMPKGFLLRIE